MDDGTMPLEAAERETTEQVSEAARARRAVLTLGAASVALLLAAGGLLWARLGPAVFSDYVLSGLAWCF